MSDQELCHSISKPIGDEKNTLKSFMTFDITQCGPVFRMVVGSQIVVPPNNPSLTMTLSWLELMTLALILVGDEKDTQIFYGIRHHTTWTYF